MNGTIFMITRVAGVAIFIAMLSVLPACTEAEPETDVDEPQAEAQASVDPIVSGEETFMTYCASCHGADGRGGGPVADVMTTRPADLTQLRAQYDGSFPADSVYAYIDGRADVQAHGTREMPVWGNVWGEEEGGELVPREEVDLRIRELVEYIRTLQQDAGDGLGG